MSFTDERVSNSPPTQSAPDLFDQFPLSFAQQRLWLLAQMEGASEAYHIPLGLSLKGDLDRAALRGALDRILARHEALRTTFALIDGELVQQITAVEGSRFLLIEHDLRSHNNATTELDRLTELEASASFDLEAGPLIRGRLIRISEDERVLLITMHHIASDGWSMGVLVHELSTLYGAFLRGEDDPLPELEIQYADYAVWQRQWVEGDILKQQAAYWKTALAGAPALLALPADHPRPDRQDFAGGFAELALDEHLSAGLRELSRRHGVTLFMTLLAAWAALLARLSGQQDVIIGTPVANRGRAEIEKLIGFFVNTLPLRLNLSGSLTVSELLEQAKTQALAAQQNQDIPFEQVVELARPVRSLAHGPLFQVMFAWQGNAQERFELPGLEVQSLPIPHRVAKFDLLLELREAGNTITGGIEYATSLFERATIDRYIGYFGNLLRAMVADDAQAVDRLAMLPGNERQQLLVDWNNTVAEYPKALSLAQLVEEQVKRTPNAVAVVYGKQRLTYRELNERANQLAHKLLKLGVGPDQVVGLFVERSTDLIVVMLAIMKTGAAYLPLDPLFPPDRLGYMLEDSGAQLLVTQQSLRRELPTFAGAVILLEDEDWQANRGDNPGIVVEPENLAYLIYTSGSTGKPKGVQIPRGALINFLWSMREWLQLSDSDRLLAVTTISFDIAGLEIWLPLLVGAQTVVANREAATDGSALRDLLDRHDITIMQATPVTWRLLFEAGWTGRPGMQAVCGGEAMPPEVAAQLVPVVKRVWNLYGPTETTIWSTGYPVTDGQKPILIGRPVANTQCYILDGHGQPVPIGVTGELNIGGDGLARGYLNRPELTAEKFVADPFRGGAARMYRTGDLACYRVDGNIECLGRVDHQVKIRGYRIELGEIEAVLKSQPEVKQAVVIVREDTPGDKRLVAYYTASPIGETEKGTIGAEQFRSHLSASLPEYMIPAAYVRLDDMPLTPNGKLDRKSLPAPETDSYSIRGYEPPQGEMEMKLAAHWAVVLKLDRVGRHDNFFDLGGHSLSAVQLISRLHQLIPGDPLPLRAVLEAPTVERLAVWLQNRNGSQEQILVQVRPGDGVRTPFFCVHGAGGNVFSLRPLAMALPADLPVYFLQAKGLDGSAPFESVEETAQYYVDEIRKVQPHGPYQLGGGCYGGFVAFEMARVLEQLGEPVASLIMIDIPNPAFGSSLPKRERLSRSLSFYFRRSAVHSRKLLTLPPREWLGYTRGRLRALDKYLRSLAGGGAKAEVTEFPNDPDWVNIKSAAGTHLGEILARVGRASRIAGSRFVPKPYHGGALIVRASDYLVTPYEDDFLGWKPVIQGSIEVFEVEGTHITIFQDSAARLMAERIDAKLRKSSAKVELATLRS
jgi:amino acid adenylation domain-containing protein